MRRDVVIVGGGLATDHAGMVASLLVGEAVDDSFAQEGYFWSDQFGSRLQFAGTVGAQPQLRLASGAMHDRAFVAVLGEPDQATAVFAMNSPREFMRTSRALRR